jgi:type II secretory pathway component PulF
MIFGAVVMALGIVGAVGAVLVWKGLAPAVPFLCIMILVYGWMLLSYIHYRHGRQEEFLHLLITTVESGAPLVPALRAYVDDRPQGAWRELWVSTFLFFLLPGYYWVWHKRHCFDHKVADVADLVEDGVPLAEALRQVPGVASRETVLAARIGQATGNLGLCLRAVGGRQLTTVWLDMVPRFVYPLTILLVLCGITSFWMIYIGPKMQKIFREMKAEIPTATGNVFLAWDLVQRYGLLAALMFPALLLLGICLFLQSPTRWHCPGIARLYRMEVQSRVLRMLAILLGAGKPVPDALGVLANSGYFAWLPRQRLETARGRVADGEPLAESLARGGLLPGTGVPLVQAAERMRNLPWALQELGDTLAGRVKRRLHHLSMVLAPLFLVAIGLLVGVVVIGFFMPIVELLSKHAD